ncbi:unnamed protein product [Parnassius apollo]|uniref:(apollo) hypothetical protein n=1 Tax=Parnassius apollo TaxID=110799 RepID=A0A8S3W8Y4_PARAO|nr:unnamed protein product [Parnassius apollo]
MAVKEGAWSDDESLLLIEEYRTREVLWNPQNENFYKQNLKKDAWDEIGYVWKITAEKCNNKMISLLSSYRREKGKEKKSKGTGKGTSDTYTSRWFAYNALKFLDDRNTPRKRKNTESIQRSVSKNNATEATQHEFTPPAPPNEHGLQEAKRSRRDENNVLTDVVGILKTTAQKLDSSSSIPDLTKSFVSFIGAKMSNYSSQTRTSVEHAIFEIIMKTDRGYYESWQH